MLLHACLHKFNWTIDYYLSLSSRKKAFILASLEIVREEEEKAEKEAKRKSKKR